MVAQKSNRFSPAARRVAKFLIFALVVHVFVLPQLGGARRGLSVISSVNPLLLLGALMLYAASLLVYAWLTQALLPAEHRTSTPFAFGTVLASTGVNHIVPGGAATTAAVNYRLLGNAGVPRDELSFALGVQAVGSAVVLNAVLWLALMISIPTTGFHPLYATAAAFGAFLITVFSASVLALRRGRDRFAGQIASLAGRLPRVDAERVRRSTLNLAKQLDVLASDRRRLVMVTALAAANWLLDAAALWLTLTAFGPLPNVIGVLVAYGLANVMAALPISPGGLGVVEAILIPTLIGFGLPAAEASVGVVAYRLVSFWLPIPVGALAYLLVNRSTGSPFGFRSEVNDRLRAFARRSRST